MSAHESSAEGGPRALHPGDEDAGRHGLDPIIDGRSHRPGIPATRGKRVAIVQSAYIPWKGYFDLIGLVDEFILYDDVQLSKGDWRNRNRLRTRSGTAWLTIPIQTSGRFRQAIADTRVAHGGWAAKHWRTIHHNYARARHFDETADVLHDLYRELADEPRLSRINEVLLREICRRLSIPTRITAPGSYEHGGDRVERLIRVCEQAEAHEYLSGPAARSYLDEARFAQRGITVRWMDYSGYPAYRQLHAPPFIHEVTIVDLLVNEGWAGARDHLLSTRRRTGPADLRCS
jgi:hypothetical protein